jgi:hypothetical protein
LCAGSGRLRNVVGVVRQHGLLTTSSGRPVERQNIGA